MSATNSQETCYSALKSCPLEKLPGFVEHLEPVIGKAGGRRFLKHTLGEQNPPFPGTISMNDVVKRLDIVWKDLNKGTNALDRKSVEAVLDTVIKIQDKDNQADVKLKEKNILIRIFTAIRSFFGNIGFNRKEILASIEKAANGAVLNLRSAEKDKSLTKEPDAPKAKGPQDVAEQEAKVEELINALSHLDANNYAKTKQILVNSENDIVCIAMRRSIKNKLCFTFLTTMGEDKFKSVFRTAAQEARDNNDYQLFALLISRSLMHCSKQDIIDSVKLATNGSKDEIEKLRLEVNNHLNDDAWKDTYGSILRDARS